ncbi:MAG: hypothetical protein WAL72_09695 [Streptosporangiaceae bacterium]
MASAEPYGQTTVQGRCGYPHYARQPQPAGYVDVVAAALHSVADKTGHSGRRYRPWPGPVIRQAAPGEERGVGHADDQTNFAKMIWKFNNVYNADRQYSEHQSQARYLLPPQAEPRAAPDRKELYVHVPTRRKAEP